jgi:putative tryptophan/tyrosine transport system substrate-binding protein
MKRRDFIGLLGAAAWPFTALSQQDTPVIGFLNGQSSEGGAPLLAAFREGLRQEGFVDSVNLRMELRWAAGQFERLPAMAKDLVNRRVTVIAAGSPPAAASLR